MKCPDCGAEILEGRKFCGDCGSPISGQMPIQLTPQVIEKRKRKKIMVGAIVAAILLVAPALAYLYYHQPVIGSGSASTTTIDAGQNVQFSYSPRQGIPPYSYSWSFGDGGTSTEKNPSHSYSIPGTYHASVTVTDNSELAGEQTSWSTTITVNPLPSVVGTVSPSIGVLSLNASFTAQGRGGMPTFSYMWHFGDGASSDAQNPTHHYSTGTYTATVVVRDGAGMTASWSVSISVNLPLAVGVIIRWMGALIGEEFTCTPSQGVPPYSFYWEFGNGQSSTLQNTTYNYGAPGTYNVSLNVTDSIGEIVEVQRTLVL
jgi:PKD repeat protein